MAAFPPEPFTLLSGMASIEEFRDDSMLPSSTESTGQVAV